ncbi:hypothetical protein BpHYR1_001026 [Brachionus plicatilis]|uniref:Uncharacterized protein n=1 Tax=Brachionus plicatilis TaxID=10195 RepID=A0A3M7QB56_BRAPC|nr:hypothetical protein BpHYR1_001026 [Brachionus plicatilis]
MNFLKFTVLFIIFFMRVNAWMNFHKKEEFVSDPSLTDRIISFLIRIWTNTIQQVNGVGCSVIVYTTTDTGGIPRQRQPYTLLRTENRNPAINTNILKFPDVFRKGIDDHENGFEQFKTAFLRLVVPQAALTQSISNWTKLNDVFPNLKGSIDLDHIIKERFVEGLFNIRLREVARTKMHKMRAFKRDEFFGIQSLIDYVDCKINGFDKNSSTVAMYTENNLYTSETDYNGKQKTTENNMNPNQKGSYQQQSYNTQYYPYNRNQKKFVNFSQTQQSDQYQHQQHQQHKKPEEQKRSVNEEILNVDSGQYKDFSNPIFGQAILNNTLVKYLCDSDAPERLKIFVLFFFKKFVISPEVIMKNVRLLVTENVTDHDFILGRDLVQKIPDFRTKFCEMQSKIRKLSNQVKKIFKSERKHLLNNSVKSKSCNSETITCLSSSSTCSTESIQMNTETLENYSEMFEAPNFRFKSIDDARQVVVEELRNISAKDVVDLRPNFNSDAAFRIEFIDSNQKPLKFLVKGVLYIHSEDRNGFLVTQFVLPKQVVAEKKLKIVTYAKRQRKHVEILAQSINRLVPNNSLIFNLERNNNKNNSKIIYGTDSSRLFITILEIIIIVVANSFFIGAEIFSKGSTLRAIHNNLNRYDDWLCVWREGMWDDECSSLEPPVLASNILCGSD